MLIANLVFTVDTNDRRSCTLVTDVGIAAVAHGCPRLKHLGAGGCIRVTDFSLRIVAVRAGLRLRALDVTGCREVG